MKTNATRPSRIAHAIMRSARRMEATIRFLPMTVRRVCALIAGSTPCRA